MLLNVVKAAWPSHEPCFFKFDSQSGGPFVFKLAGCNCDGVRRGQFAHGDVSEEDLKARQAKAMADPEIQGILSDPIMRQVLNDFQQDPKAAQQHMRQPQIMAKLQKLMAAGIVQMR